MKRKYENPPIQEALCEIFFSQPEWDNTMPGLFYEQIKKDHPNKTQIKQLNVEVNVGDNKHAAKFSDNEDRIQFRNVDGSQIVQLASNLLVVNQLRPYPHFEAWLPVVRSTFEIYDRFAKPKGIEKIGVRYINRVLIPKLKIQMEDYFNVYPQLPKELGDQHGPFMMRFELFPKNPKHQLFITFATSPSNEPNSIAFALDIYDTFSNPESKSVDSVIKIAAESHDNILTAFENSIKDSLRAVFQEKKA